MQEQVIVYQAYGSTAILMELVYSIRSIERLHSHPQWVYHVYTDQQAWLEPYLEGINVYYHQLTPALIKEWKGPDDFVHRVKIKMLQHFSQQHSHTKILYLDTDIICNATIDALWNQLAPNHFLMHEDEGALNSNSVVLFKKIYPEIQTAVKKRHLDTADFHIWNAGVIGFESSNKTILNDVLQLTDLLFQQYPKHIMEQLSFSYCLQQQGIVKDAKTFFFHYWLLKEFRNILTDVFTLPVPQCIHKLNLLQQQSIPEKLCAQKQNNVLQRSSGIFKKWWIKKWECPSFNTLEELYQLY